MKKQFTVDEAIQYCADNKVNMLMSDINWMEENAVFKLFKVAKKNIGYYIEESVEDEDHNFIVPGDLRVRGIDTVWLDTSGVKRVTKKNASEIMNESLEG